MGTSARTLPSEGPSEDGKLSPLQLLECATLALGPVMVRLPTYAGTLQSNLLVLLPVLWVGVLVFLRWLFVPAYYPGTVGPIARLWQRWRSEGFGLPAVVAALYFASVLILEVRGAYSGRLPVKIAAIDGSYWCLLGFLILGTLVSLPPGRARMTPMLVVGGASGFVAINFLMRLVGLPLPVSLEIIASSRQLSTLAGLLGLRIDRMAFPLGNGINGFGIMSGIAWVGGAALLFSKGSRRSERVVGIAGFVLGLLGVLMVDSRFPFLAAIVVIGMLAWWPARWLRHWAWIAPAAVWFPLLMAFLAIQLAAHDSSWLPVRGSADLYTLNGRTFVWAVVGSELSQPTPWHWIGAGFEGPQASGVIYKAGDFVGVIFDMEHLSVHNAMLQQIMDSGYLGLGIFVATLWLVLRCSAAAHRRLSERRTLVGITAFIVLAGATEAVPGLSASDVLFVFLLLGTYAILTRRPPLPRHT